MRESSTWKTGQFPGLRNSALGMAVGLMAITLLGATGCDTMARIAFPERRFQNIRPVSLTAPGDACGGVDGVATLRMVLMANDDTPIKDGEDVSLTTVELRASDISFDNGRLYSFPNEDCVSGDCESPMVCAATSFEEMGDRCGNPSTVTISGTPRFVGKEPQSQALVVAMSHEGRWRGWLPSDVGSLYRVDQHGTQIAGQDIEPNPARAGDSRRDRFGALGLLRTDWAYLVDGVVGPDGREAFFGLWSFAETDAAVTSWLEETGSPGSVWTRQPQRVTEALDAFDGNPDQVRADVYQSVMTILRRSFEEQEVMNNVEHRTLVLIVGGHDERRRANLTVDDVIERAQELGVKVHVLHVDPPLDATRLRDDYRYYEQQPGCSSDADCKNFEECRTPQFFRQQATGTGITYPQDTDAQYCLPKRDENGRLGPIHDYQRLACETGGGYSYIPVLTADLLYSRLRGMAMETEAAWEVDLNIGEASSLSPGQPYLLEGNLRVRIGQEHGYNFSTAGPLTSPTSNDPHRRDTRPVFFTPAQ